MNRDKFERSSANKIKIAVAQAKKIRALARLLELQITAKEAKIKEYDKTFTEIAEQLVKLQAKLYAGGTS